MKTVAIIDAVADGLNTLSLPAHVTFKYVRPLSLAVPTGVRVPALSVAVAQEHPVMLDTPDDYESTTRLLITWYAGAMSAMTVGAMDEALGAAALTVSADMVDLMMSWAVGVPGLDFQSELTLGDVHMGTIEGGIYAIEMNASVRYWSV